MIDAVFESHNTKDYCCWNFCQFHLPVLTWVDFTLKCQLTPQKCPTPPEASMMWTNPKTCWVHTFKWMTSLQNTLQQIREESHRIQHTETDQPNQPTHKARILKLHGLGATFRPGKSNYTLCGLKMCVFLHVAVVVGYCTFESPCSLMQS